MKVQPNQRCHGLDIMYIKRSVEHKYYSSEIGYSLIRRAPSVRSISAEKVLLEPRPSVYIFMFYFTRRAVRVPDADGVDHLRHEKQPKNKHQAI